LNRTFTKYNEGLGLYLALTGQSLKGKNLVWCGLATHYIQSHRLEELKKELSKVTTQNKSNEEISQIVSKFSDSIVRGRIARPCHKFDKNKADIENIGEINAIFNQSSIQRIYNALEFTDTPFAQTTLDEMRSMSPLS